MQLSKAYGDDFPGVGARLDMLDGAAGHGASEQAIERILEYGEAGAEMVNIALRAPVDPDMIDAYLNQILPAVRAT